MKVLLVIDSLGSGGAQRLMVYLAKGLINNGNKVDVFIYNTNYNFFREDIESMGVKIYTSTLKKKYLKPISIIYSLRKTLNNKYDIVISLMHMPSVYSAFSCIGLFQTKLIVCELSSSNAPIPFFKRLLFYLASLLSFKVVANSFTEKINIEKRPRLSGKVEAIWNGYEINKMKFKLSKNDNKIKTLLIVGRVAYPKNGLNLLKAIKLFIDNNGWSPKFVWAGRDDIDQRSINMQEKMKKYLDDNPQVKSKIDFIGEVKNIKQLYHSSDALIHPSIYEGLPNVICEAMLLGCNVIASNVCDHPIILKNERGLLFDPKLPESICKTIEKFNLMDINQRNKMAIKAREFAENNFTINQMAISFEKISKYGIKK